MTETEIIRKEIRPILEKLGMLIVKHHGGPFAEVGVADLLCCWNGRFIAIEVKKPDGVTSPMQTRFLERVRDAGGLAGTVYTHRIYADLAKILGIAQKMLPLE